MHCTCNSLPAYITMINQIPSLGVEGVWLWLAASGDRRVSVWSAEWSQDVCHLLDWLTFPGPACAPDGTRLRRGHKVSAERQHVLLVVRDRSLPSGPFAFSSTLNVCSHCLSL